MLCFIFAGVSFISVKPSIRNTPDLGKYVITVFGRQLLEARNEQGFGIFSALTYVILTFPFCPATCVNLGAPSLFRFGRILRDDVPRPAEGLTLEIYSNYSVSIANPPVPNRDRRRSRRGLAVPLVNARKRGNLIKPGTLTVCIGYRCVSVICEYLIQRRLGSCTRGIL